MKIGANRNQNKTAHEGANHHTELPVRGDLDGHMAQSINRAQGLGPVQGDLAGVEDRQGSADHRRLSAGLFLGVESTDVVFRFGA